MLKIFLMMAMVLLAFPAMASPLGNPLPSIASAALESSHILKTSHGYLNGFHATSTTVAGYVLIFDSATVPADGAVTPVGCYALQGTPQTVWDSWLTYPNVFLNGIVIVFSTTGCFTKTASATAFFNAQVQ